MTVTPEAKEKIKEMLQMCYAFILHQMPEILMDGKTQQTFDLELECPADLLYKECKLRTADIGKVKLNLTFFAPERKSMILFPFGRPQPLGVPEKPEPVKPPTIPEPDPED